MAVLPNSAAKWWRATPKSLKPPKNPNEFRYDQPTRLHPRRRSSTGTWLHAIFADRPAGRDDVFPHDPSTPRPPEGDGSAAVGDEEGRQGHLGRRDPRDGVQHQGGIDHRESRRERKVGVPEEQHHDGDSKGDGQI